MILPITIYNDPILRNKCKEINPYYPNLNKLIYDMFETMYNAKGIGLAAPQIGKNIRLFIIDITCFQNIKNSSFSEKFKKVFINSKLLKNYGKIWKFREGCLSIPNVIEDIKRKSCILIEYYDQFWNKHIQNLNGIQARVIQHEYDHIEGKLFIDYFSDIKKQLINNELKNISQGKFRINYPIKLHNK